MGLETATYINSLDATNPPSSDPVGQADDHLRLIKSALKATFPNITGPVTATQAQLNVSIPLGVICMWSGTHATIPTGWALCSGQTVAKSDGSGNLTLPDLRGRFILGSTSVAVNPPGETGGSPSATTSAAGGFSTTANTSTDGAHSHSGAVGGTAITTAQMPSHVHASAANSGSGGLIRVDGNNFGNTNNYLLQAGGIEGSGGVINTGAAGGDQPHTHAISADGGHFHSTTVTVGNHTHTVTVTPVYYALAYIAKV